MISFLFYYLTGKNKFISIEGESNKKIVLMSKKCNLNSTFPVIIYNKDSDDFQNCIKNNNYEIINGMWLFRFVIPEIIDYILDIQKSCIEKEEISIFINEVNDINIELIKFFAINCKVLNIITSNKNGFSFLEKYINDNYGILINISGNLRKGALKSDIIINFDFNQELLSKCVLDRYSIIINLVDGVNYCSKRFDGININFYKIKIPGKYLKIVNHLKYFGSEESIYECFLYRRALFDYIREILVKDHIRIWYLMGINGRIDVNEFLRVKKLKMFSSSKRKLRKTIDKFNG